MHPIEPEMNDLYGIIFVDQADRSYCHSKNICIFADGELDRSPTGTGVSARAAIEFLKGNLGKNEPMLIESITIANRNHWNRFEGTMECQTTIG